MKPLAERPHVVYEFWMGEVCLYVGMTRNLKSRLSDHRRNNTYHRAATELRVTDCPNRRAAEILEHRRIVEARPANNRRGVPA